jgi:hypothetical protein
VFGDHPARRVNRAVDDEVAERAAGKRRRALEQVNLA